MTGIPGAEGGAGRRRRFSTALHGSTVLHSTVLHSTTIKPRCPPPWPVAPLALVGPDLAPPRPGAVARARPGDMCVRAPRPHPHMAAFPPRAGAHRRRARVASQKAWALQQRPVTGSGGLVFAGTQALPTSVCGSSHPIELVPHYAWHLGVHGSPQSLGEELPGQLP